MPAVDGGPQTYEGRANALLDDLAQELFWHPETTATQLLDLISERVGELAGELGEREHDLADAVDEACADIDRALVSASELLGTLEYDPDENPENTKLLRDITRRIDDARNYADKLQREVGSGG